MSSGEQNLIGQILSVTTGQSGRAFVMARRYAMGETLDEVARDYGVTRERVRQIINQQTPWNATEIRLERRRSADATERANNAAVLEWSKSAPGASVSEASETLGLPEEEIRRYLGRRLARHERTLRKRADRRSNEDLLKDLKRFNEETGGTTSAAYAKWARETGVPGPQTVAIRFGSWNDAATLAGFKEAEQIDRDRRHTEEDLWAALVEGVHSGVFTAREFEDWLASAPGAPSLALIRHRLPGRFQDIRDEALKIVSGRSSRDPAWITEVTTRRDWQKLLEEEDPLNHMREARRALGKEITMLRYIEWSRATKRPGPGTLIRRSGMTWSSLVSSVGGTVVNKAKRISDEELLAWLRAYIDSNPDGPYSGYVEWRLTSGAPSPNVISERFGGWDRARSLAIQT